jgi:hypothetical protein
VLEGIKNLSISKKELSKRFVLKNPEPLESDNAGCLKAGLFDVKKDIPGYLVVLKCDLSENMDLPIMRRPIQFAGVEIGWGCDIGVNAVILPGVKLGDRVQVAAGAVVTRSFPSGSVIAGVPARQINAST